MSKVITNNQSINSFSKVWKLITFWKDFAHCVWPAAPYTLYKSRRKKKKTAHINKTAQTRTMVMSTFRWGSWGTSLWEWEHNDKTAQKKEILAQKKKKNIKDFFQRKRDKRVWQTNKKSVQTWLYYLQTVQSFYFGERDLYTRTWYFSSVRSNLFASIYIWRELTQMQKLWLPAQ